MGEHLTTRNTPAVTMVAAWIKADTGVGPSIASGNQVWSKNWADFPIAPINRNIQIKVIKFDSNPKNINFFSANWGVAWKTSSKLILPKIGDNLEARKSQIAENIESAEKQREESDQKLKDYEKIINGAKIEAKNIFNQARKKILRDINNKKENLEKEIYEEVKKTEQEILGLKNKSSEKINKIAIETSTDLIKEIFGAEVNNSNISAIVEDISKKNEEKYYGN